MESPKKAKKPKVFGTKPLKFEEIFPDEVGRENRIGLINDDISAEHYSSY